MYMCYAREETSGYSSVGNWSGTSTFVVYYMTTTPEQKGSNGTLADLNKDNPQLPVCYLIPFLDNHYDLSSN
jgi:hypothetical protein